MEKISDAKAHRKALDKTGFWGSRGAGCLFLCTSTKRILFAHRSRHVQEPNTFGTWGGAIDKGETPIEGALREVREESGYKKPFSIIPLATFEHSSGFKYFNFLALVKEEFKPKLDKETQGYVWVDFGDWPSPLHPGCTYLLKKSSSEIKKIIKTEGL